MRAPEVYDENTSSVSLACRKRRLNGAVFRNKHIKRVAPSGMDSENYSRGAGRGPKIRP